MRLGLTFAICVGLAGPAAAQTRGYVGGTIAVVIDPQTKGPSQVGGATWSGGAVAGVMIVPRLSLEVEPSMSGDLAARPYTYRPSLDRAADVQGHGRYTILAAQLRARTGLFEPVAGVAYVRSTYRRRAVFTPGGQLYFEDERSTNRLALTVGIDAAAPVSARVAIVPTVRLFIVGPESGDAVQGGRFVLRAGLGARIGL